jgi:heme exporter protein A
LLSTPYRNLQHMLEGINLGCTRGGRTLFGDLNLRIPPGTLLQVQGPNGSGKTSLLRIICGLLPPESGEVRWQGTSIRRLGEDFAASFTYLGHRNGIKEELSSLENLRIATGLCGAEITRDQAKEALTQTGLAGKEDLAVRFLSEGQRRRAALARLTISGTKLWVLDEVLASLDAAAVDLVNSLLERHLSTGGMAVVATHQELSLAAGSFQRLELGTPGTAAASGAAPTGLPSS